MKGKKFVIMFLIIILLIIMVYIYLNKFPTKPLTQNEILELINKTETLDNIYIYNTTEINDAIYESIRYQKDGIVLIKEPDKNNTCTYWIDMNNNEGIEIQEGYKTWYKIDLNEDDDELDYRFIKYEKYNNSKCVVIETEKAHESMASDEEMITTMAKMWVDLKTGVILKAEYKDSMGQEYTSHSTVTLNKVKDEDVAKPNLEGYTEYELNKNE